MKQSNYTVQVLEPTNGWLTQKEAVKIQERIFSKKVFLGVNDKPDNWKEINDNEYNLYQVELMSWQMEQENKEGV